MMTFVDRVLSNFGYHRTGTDVPSPPPPPSPVSLPTLEVFGQPGHGKSSYLWAVLFMLRKLSLVWPDFTCSALDDGTEVALKSIHESVHEGKLPDSMPTEHQARYRLLLRNMERWGEKRLDVWDRKDSIFSANEHSNVKADINWRATIFWLLSLADLKKVQVEYLDMLLHDLVQKRGRAGHSLYSSPLNLVIVLAKCDSIPELPLALRQYLIQDPLWMAVSKEPTLWFTSIEKPIHLGAEALRQYLATLYRADEEIRRWLDSTLAGHMLLQRAKEHHLNLRFSVVSATGSGISERQRLQVPWSPRRVLDPLFWALEMENMHSRTPT